MSELSLVKSESFGAVQCDFWQDENGEILMTRDQIGRALEYSDPRVAITKIHDRHEERLSKFSVVTKLVSTDGKTYETYLYTSKGVMEICRWSQQPKANAFMDWVWEAVESIRKHGAYMTPEKIEEVLLNPDVIINLATRLKKEQQARIKAQKQLKEQAPLVGFAETCLASQDSILVREMAKIASKHGVLIGQNRLFQKLREWGLIMQRKTEPYQWAVDAGYFEVVQSVKETSSGNMIFSTTRVTTKGQVYIVERLKREFTKTSEEGSVG